jgi:HrpA-like RNA helicase
VIHQSKKLKRAGLIKFRQHVQNPMSKKFQENFLKFYFLKLFSLFFPKSVNSTLPPEIHAKLQKPDSTSNLNPLNNQAYSTKYYDILRKRLKLPVWEYKKLFMYTLQSNKVTVLVGETGKQSFLLF